MKRRHFDFRAGLPAILCLAALDMGQACAAEKSATVIRITEPPRQYRSGPSVYGPVTVVLEPSMDRMKTELCPSFRYSVGLLLGCVNINEGRGCAIVLWSDLKRAPALRSAVERHERAHCRGWGAGHEGGKERVYHMGRGFFSGAEN